MELKLKMRNSNWTDNTQMKMMVLEREVTELKLEVMELWKWWNSNKTYGTQTELDGTQTESYGTQIRSDGTQPENDGNPTEMMGLELKVKSFKLTMTNIQRARIDFAVCRCKIFCTYSSTLTNQQICAWTKINLRRELDVVSGFSVVSRNRTVLEVRV